MWIFVYKNFVSLCLCVELNKTSRPWIEEGREVFFCCRAYDYIMHEVTPSVVPMAVRIAISV